MRTLTACLALLAAFPLLAAEKAAEKVAWQKATLKGTKTRVQFPGKPTEETDNGMASLLLEVMDGKAAYLAMMSPAASEIDITDKDVVKKALDKGRDASVKALKGELLSEKDVKLGKYPGRAMDIKSAGGIYRARVYLTGDRAYQVIVLGPKEFVDGADAKKFLDSLTIGD